MLTTRRLLNAVEVDPVLPSDKGTEKLVGDTRIPTITPAFRVTLTTMGDVAIEITRMIQGIISRGTCQHMRVNTLHHQAGITITALGTLGTRTPHLTGEVHLVRLLGYSQEVFNSSMDPCSTILHLMSVFILRRFFKVRVGLTGQDFRSITGRFWT